MLNVERLEKLAEAVADGDTPDWSSAELAARDDDDRAFVAELRALASIGSLFGTLSSSHAGRQDARTVLAPGTIWCGLRLLDHVGRGRFGDVYRAWDPALDREVALKLIPRDDAGDGADSQVVEEGRLMARVHHPNVVSIFGAQRLDDATGLWMEFVRGRTLAEELAERGPFAAEELVAVGTALCHALQAVHDAGLVHRDVTARNVMRDARGRVVLGDFGIGRELRDDEASPALAGTPAYIAPEIFAGRAATPQSDLYSVGALLFHLATASYPVPERSLRALREAHEQGRLTSVSTLRSDLPPALVTAIERALSADPATRFSSAEGMAEALDDISRRESASPRASSLRLRWVTAAVALVALAGLGLGWRASRAAPPSAPFAARDWVLVSAFDNRTGEVVLDGTLEFALERELANSTFVNVVPRARVIDTLKLMQRPPDTRLDGDTAREVAVRDGGIRAVIAGRIEKVGTRYTASATVLDIVDGRALASVVEAGSDANGLLDATRRLALGVRERLGESLPAAPHVSPLPKVTTASLKALRLYAEAEGMQNAEGGWGARTHAAEALLRAGVAEDPAFAAAQRLLALVLQQRPIPKMAEVLNLLEQAVSLSGSAPEIERLINEAELHAARAVWEGGGFGRSFRPFTEQVEFFRAAQQRAIAAYEAAIQLDSRNHDALIRLDRLLTDGNYFADVRRTAAVAERLAELRPHSAFWQARAAIQVLAARHADLDRARHYVRRALEIVPTDPLNAEMGAKMRLFEGWEAWLNGHAEVALHLADQVGLELKLLPPDLARGEATAIYRFYLALGRLDAAEKFAQLINPNAETIVAVAREDRRALRAVLARNYPALSEGAGVASAYVDAGRVAEARKAIDLIKGREDGARLGQPPFVNTLLYLPLIEGQVLVAEGRIDEGIALLRQLLEYSPITVGDGGRWARATRTLAEAWAQKGDLGRAIALLEAAPLRLDMVVRGGNYTMEWLQIRDKLAQFYIKAGRHPDAAVVDAQLSRLLAVADEDHPIKRRLSARAATLSTSARPRTSREPE